MKKLLLGLSLGISISSIGDATAADQALMPNKDERTQQQKLTEKSEPTTLVQTLPDQQQLVETQHGDIDQLKQTMINQRLQMLIDKVQQQQQKFLTAKAANIQKLEQQLAEKSQNSQIKDNTLKPLLEELEKQQEKFQVRG